MRTVFSRALVPTVLVMTMYVLQIHEPNIRNPSSATILFVLRLLNNFLHEVKFMSLSTLFREFIPKFAKLDCGG